MRRVLASFRRALALLGVGVVVASGCYKSGEGPDPDDKAPYYPVGIAISRSGNFLFLANSNFDLKYNSGTLTALDAVEIRKRALDCRHELKLWRDQAEKTAAKGKTIEAAPACRGGVNPDRTPRVQNAATEFAKASVRIGAFAADVSLVDRFKGGVRREDGGRLLVPVRGDASMTVVDFEESPGGITLRCAPGATPNHFGDKCAPAWRLTGGEGGGAGSRGLTLEGEPFATATVAGPIATPYDKSPNGITTVIHQSSGDVSLFVDTTVDNDLGQPTARLAYTLTGLPGGATAIAPFELPGDTESPRFLVANRSQSSMAVVQFFPDPTVDRSGLVLSGYVNLTPQSQGYDSRGVIVDPPNPGETRPTRAFVTNRTPAAIVVGQFDDRGVLSFYDNVALPVGPSRIERAVVGNKTFIVAASFDARSLIVFDPDSRRVSNVVLTHRGPYAIAIDAARPDPADATKTVQLAYIANFTDSTIQVLDLTPGATESLIYSVGAPSGPLN
jgi:hypothetical protein